MDNLINIDIYAMYALSMQKNTVLTLNAVIKMSQKQNKAYLSYHFLKGPMSY